MIRYLHLNEIFINIFTSTSSTSFKFLSVTLRSCLIAGAGPIPIILGSTPTMLYPIKRANGVSCSVLTASSLAKIIAPAPSQTPYVEKLYVCPESIKYNSNVSTINFNKTQINIQMQILL